MTTAAIATKTFSVHFYRGHLGPDDDKGKDFKAQLKTLNKDQEILSNSKIYGLRLLDKQHDYLFFEIKQYRDEAPHIGKPKGTERKINFQPGERVIEKAFAVYCCSLNILCMQMTQHFRSPGEIATILTSLGTKTAHFSPLLNNNAVTRLSNKVSDIKTIECAVAIPTTNQLTPSDDWEKSIITLADGAPGRLHFTISGDMRGTTKNPINASTVTRMLSAAKTGLFDKARATTSTGEDIDLLNDRLRDKITTTMDRKYPLPKSVKNELITAFTNNSAVLSTYKP